MTPDETLNKAIWWVLKELYKEKLSLASPNELINFEYLIGKSQDSVPSVNDQRRAARVLENNHAIQIIGNIYANPIVTEALAETMGEKPSGVEIKIADKFDEILQEYKKVYEPPTHIESFQNKFLNKFKENDEQKASAVSDRDKKALRGLSVKTRSRILLVVEKLLDLAEITPAKDPIYFEPTSYLGSDNHYDERTIVSKLEELKILNVESDDALGNLLIFTTLGKLKEAHFELEKAKAEDERQKMISQQALRPTPAVKHKGSMFPTGSNGGFWNLHERRTQRRLRPQEIADEFSLPNIPFVLSV